jgi:hypothetical protein
MPGFDDLILTVTPRITHEEDFAFAKNKGELANLVRSDYLPRVCELCAMRGAGVWIDDEGDIVVGGGVRRFISPPIPSYCLRAVLQ